MITATSCIHAPTFWKPGGTAIFLLGEWAGAAVDMNSDDMGRWCSFTLRGQDDDIFTIYSAYNVVDTSISNAGPSTVFAQQWQILKLSGQHTPSPRKQFIKDLQAELLTRHQAGEHILLCGDFNEKLGSDPSLMSSICVAQDLFDIHDLQLGDEAHLPTYSRGTKRLDYCLASSAMQPFVRQAGINLFNEIFNSDHRALYVDLDLSSLLGKLPPQMAHHRQRLIGSDSQSVSSFIAKVFDHFSENNGFAQYNDFEQDASQAVTPWRAANQIDYLLGQALHAGEQTCKKRPKAPWSEALHLASLQVRFWKCKYTEATTRVNLDSVTTPLRDQIWPDATPFIPTQLRALRNRLRCASKALKRTRREAYQLRKSFLEEQKIRIALRRLTGDPDAEQALRTINRQLHDKEMFQAIKKVIHPSSSDSLTKVEIVQTEQYLHPETGQTVTRRNVQVINTRESLEQAIIQRNRRHFAQAFGTPFTIPPLSFISTKNGLNMYSDAKDNPIILPATSFIETRTVLDILKERSKVTIPRWSDNVTFEDFISGLLHWRESTSTSPSGRHLGMYKSLTTAHCDRSGEFDSIKTPDGPSIKEQATAILRVIHGLASMAAREGFYLSRWIQVVNVMIYKKPGCIELDRLRVIHLFEADFNLMVGILFGRRAMFHQVDRQLIHSGQYGKPGGECQDAAICKVLHNTLSHLTHTPMGQFESDATACFDRVVMDFALLCFQTTGAPMGPMRMWEQTLFHIVHKVKTAHGISQASYHYSDASPIIGPGQGSRGGPAACSTATSVLIEAMDKLCYGLSFCDPSKTLHYKATVKMFIDDATKGTNDFQQWLQAAPTASTLVDRLTHDAQTWERCLFTSGGLLNLSKCLFYVVMWNFDAEGRASLLPKGTIPDVLLTNGFDTTPVPVQQFDVSEAHRYLGDWLAPNLQMATAATVLKNTGRTFGERLLPSPLRRHDAWVAYFAVLIPALTYSLCVSHHSEKVLNSIQSFPTRAALMKCGFNRNTARAVVYGPQRYGGLGFRNLVVEQGIAQLQMIMRHVRAQTEQGQLFLITLRWWQLQSGMDFPLLADPRQTLPHLQWNWFTALRSFLRNIQGSLHVPSVSDFLPLPLRQGDQCLMDLALRLPKIRPAELKAFNRCRLHLGVMFLSEISSLVGDQIARDAWTGFRPRQSRYLWPFQPKPGPLAFRIWRRVLKQLLTKIPKQTSAATRNLSLASPLGCWHTTSKWFRDRQEAFYSPHSQTLYKPDGTQFSCHPNKTVRKRPKHPVKGFHVTPTQSVLHLPKDVVPVHVKEEATTFTIPATIPKVWHDPSPLPTRDDSWDAYISSLPQWEQTLFQHVTFLVDFEDLLVCLLGEETLLLASDGGAAEQKGSFGCVVATQDSLLIECHGPAFGLKPSSFRTEGYGMLAALRLFYHVHAYHQLEATVLMVILYTDSLSLIARLSRLQKSPTVVPRSTLASEADVLMQLQQSLSDILSLGLPTDDFHLQHVEGHQDTKYPDRELTWDAQLNQRCDELASDQLKLHHITPLVPFLPASHCSLTVANRTITHHLPGQIRSLASLRAFQLYLHKHHEWDTLHLFDDIDWDLFSTTMKSLPFHKRMFITKWLNDLVPFQVQQQKFHQSPSDSCPSSCGHPEDKTHFLRCPQQDRTKKWSDFQDTMRKTFEIWKIDPYLRRVLLNLFPHQDAPSLEMVPEPYLQLLSLQQRIGTDSIFFGLLTKPWTIMQHKYLKHVGALSFPNQAQHALKQVLTAIFEHCVDLWLLRNEHLHGTTISRQQSYKRIHLLAQIAELYQSSADMLPSDREIFSVPLDHRQTQSISTLKAFYRLAAPVVKISIQQAKELGRSFRPIDQYFLPRRILPTTLRNTILGNSLAQNPTIDGQPSTQ